MLYVCTTYLYQYHVERMIDDSLQIRIHEIIPADCSHNCTNTIGSYNCYCRIDYQLNVTDSSSCDGKCHNIVY